MVFSQRVGGLIYAQTRNRLIKKAEARFTNFKTMRHWL